MTSTVALTPFELELVLNAGILHAKNSIVKKVYELFATVSNQYVEAAANRLVPELTNIAPKISRGEQYLGLPYLMLDYPRNFAKGETFAIRTFFWWGNYFSIHLQLSGQHQGRHAPHITNAIKSGQFDGWYIGVHESEWHHHFEQDNYQYIEEGQVNIDLLQSPFIKLAKKIPLDEWDDVQSFLITNFTKLIDLTGA